MRFIIFFSAAVSKVTNTSTIAQHPGPKVTPIRSHLLARNGLQLSKPKRMTEKTTQTNSWSLKTPLKESTDGGTAIDMSNSEESMESEDEFYCKSDTLNDASMITEEIASEFIIVPKGVSEKKSEKISDPIRSSKSSNRCRLKNDQISNTEQVTKASRSERLMSKHSAINEKSSVIDLKSLTRTLILTSKLKDDSHSIPIQISKATCSEHMKSEIAEKEESHMMDRNAFKRGSLTRCKTTITEDMIEIDQEQLTVKEDTLQELKEDETNVLRPEEDEQQSQEEKISELNHEAEAENIQVEILETKEDDVVNDHDNGENKTGQNIECKTEDKFEQIDADEEKGTEEILESQVTVGNSVKNVKEDDILPINVTLTTEEEIVDDSTEEHVLRKTSVSNLNIIVSSDNETSYSPKSISECSTDGESERSSSIKENDNLSLEYSSHWTAEYSSTEASESEDDEFKQRFREYKRTLLEDDEGIAASCEDEISHNTNYRIGEVSKYIYCFLISSAKFLSVV